MAKKRDKKKVNQEKNRLLEITKVSIPYIKDLKLLPLIKSTNACILMQQIEYWMSKYPNGFFKFLAPPTSIQYAYKEGDSWAEELGISGTEYRTAFDQIGVRYKSKKEYDQAKENGDEFRSRFYCSYFNKVSRLTHYFRNHDKVEKAIDFLAELQTLSSRNENIELSESTILTTRDKESEFIEVNNIDSESTEITTKNISNIYQERESSTDDQNSLLNKNLYIKENENYKNGNVMEALLPSYHVNESLNQNGSGDSPAERVLIPLDFEPTWDAKYRAINKYLRKSPAEATKSFINKKRESGTKMTIEQWHQAWEGWMSREWETCGNDDLETEHLEILNKVWNDVYDASLRCNQHLFSYEEISLYLKDDFSDYTITDAINRLFERDYFGRIGEYYFNWAEIKDSKEIAIELQQQISELGLADEPIEVYSKLPYKKSLNEIKASRKRTQTK